MSYRKLIAFALIVFPWRLSAQAATTTDFTGVWLRYKEILVLGGTTESASTANTKDEKGRQRYLVIRADSMTDATSADGKEVDLQGSSWRWRSKADSVAFSYVASSKADTTWNYERFALSGDELTVFSRGNLRSFRYKRVDLPVRSQ